ncbi:MAG TPA: SAM-dependent methyltransferase [Streptosporangiaceae bacterium]|nr:SAM-dependent methyltransferase [Streptosporangiaceae bacterium]
MFRRRAPRHGFTATVRTPRPAAHPAAPPASGTPAAGRDPGGPAPAGLDVSTAHPARVWNYWLGGRDFFAADRAAGEQISQEFPHLAQTARAQRAFLVRAVRFLAGPARIRQFLDIGAGLPAGGNTHEIAQRIAPDTGIVYTDNDPAVLIHARALLQTPLLASTPEGTVSYVDADLRDVTALLAGSARTLDLEQPVALIMLGVLGHLDDHGAARSITSQLMDALPSGSYLAIADGVAGTDPVSEAQQRYNDAAALPYHLRRPDELASFFDGLDLIEPGVVPCPQWKPDASGRAAPPEEAAAYCGVARKR